MTRWLLLLSVGCVAGPGRTGTDTDVDTGSDTDRPPRVDCAFSGPPELQIAQDIGTGPHVDGEPIHYGTPPQGGAPYTPFELRVHAALEVSNRVEVVATVTDVATGEALGQAAQGTAFLCANVGVHAGWRLGNEVHPRFDGWALDALEGREVRVTVTVPTPDGDATAVATGPLAWSLGRPDAP